MYKKILLPTDGSKNAENEISRAIKLLDDDGELIIVSVATKIDAHHFQSKADVKKLNDAFVEEAQENVEKMQEKIDPSFKVSTKVLVNSSPADCIIDVADNNDVDLIVISRSNKTGINKLILGSVAEKVVKNSDIDVLLVHK